MVKRTLSIGSDLESQQAALEGLSPRSHGTRPSKNRVENLLKKVTCNCFAETCAKGNELDLEKRMKFLRILLRITLNIFTAVIGGYVLYHHFDDSIKNYRELLFFKVFNILFSFIILFPTLMRATATFLFFALADNVRDVDKEIPKLDQLQMDLSSTLGNMTLLCISSFLMVPLPFLLLRCFFKIVFDGSAHHEWCLLMGLVKYSSTLLLFCTSWVLISSQKDSASILYSLVSIYFLANVDSFLMSEVDHRKRSESIGGLRRFYYMSEIATLTEPAAREQIDSMSSQEQIDYMSHISAVPKKQDNSMEFIDHIVQTKGYRSSILTMKRQPMNPSCRNAEAPYRRIIGRKEDSPDEKPGKRFWNRRQKVLDLQHRGRLSTLGIQADIG